MSDQPTNPNPPRRLHPRIIALLAGLIVLISASVIATDLLSPRNRHPTTLPAPAPATTTTGATP